MPSSPDQRINGLKIAGWALRIIGVIVLTALLYQAATYFLYFPQITSYSSLSQIVTQFIPLIIAVGLVQWGSGHFFAQAKEVEHDLEEKLTGYVTSNQSMTIETISRWTGLPQRKAADLMARLAAKGKLKGYTIDIPSQSIFRTLSDQRPAGQPYRAPNLVQVPPAVDIPDEAVKIKAKLYELDLLKKQGRISEDEYNEMKGDLERKLVNLDSGTQVY